MAWQQAVRRALNGLSGHKRTWTAAQLTETLTIEKGSVTTHGAQVKYLSLMGARYVRTQYVLRYRQARAAGEDRAFWLLGQGLPHPEHHPEQLAWALLCGGAHPRPKAKEPTTGEWAP